MELQGGVGKEVTAQEAGIHPGAEGFSSQGAAVLVVR
jgi:hypothetical protein